MTTKTLTGTYPAGYTLKAAYYGLDIASTASVGGAGVLLTKTGAVSNYGVIAASSGAHAGIEMANGGTVANRAEITGYYGVVMGTTEPLTPVWSTVTNRGYIGGEADGVQINRFGQVSNYGTIIGAGRYGANVGANGTVRNFGTISGATGAYIAGAGSLLVNGGAGNTTALIKGGVVAYSTGASVTNFGTISGTSYAIALLNGARLTNGGPSHIGLIEGVNGVATNAYATTVVNYATIAGLGNLGEQHGDGQIGGLLQNTAGAEIYGFTGVIFYGYGAVTNSGSIHGKGTGLGVYGSYGVVMREGGRLINGTATTGQAGQITGYEAVSILGGAGYVHNDGFIGSTGPDTSAVILASGSVINGDGYGQILGTSGVVIAGAGTVTNLGGGIQGSVAFGVVIGGAGVVVNGAAKAIDEASQIQGYAGGVVCNASLTLGNFATISSSHGQGVYADGGGSVTNGSAKDKTALITGVGGVLGKIAAATVKNFGTITGTASSGYGVDLIDGGSVTNGATTDTAALIGGAGGVKLGTSGSVVNFGAIKGSGAPGGGYGAVLEAGADLTNGSLGDTKAMIGGFGGVIVYGADTVTNFGTLGDGVGSAVLFQNSSATLVVEAGSTFEGEVDGDGGTLDLASGVGRITGLFTNGDLTVSGSMAATTFFSFGIVEIGAGAQFSDTGAVSIAAGQIVTASGSLTLGGSGNSSITNAGVFVVYTGGSLDLAGAVTSTGTLALRGGTITVAGAFGGNGSVTIAGGTLDAAGAFTTSVSFNGNSGVLELADSQAYTGTVSGFSKTGTTSFDLLDIGFVSASEATFSGTKTGGVLTVTDGTHTAHISLTGNYLASTWVASSNGHGGTIVVDPTAPNAPSTQGFVAAMAGMGGAPSSPLQTTPAWTDREPLLLCPRTAQV